ncbi:MAG: histone deacetylase [Planctomycetaceae bacterium]|nr:histone deacetylase [Planctomycetaceae bacterium]
MYDARYNMGLLGMERWHPFDVRKYERAWALIEKEIVGVRERFLVGVDRACAREELLNVHTAEYLDRLREPAYLAEVFEVPLAKYVPAALIERGILRPMRWATRGTMIAAEEALKQGMAINLGGGFHHAKPGTGEGFCVYSDIALGVWHVRSRGLIGEDARVVYVDLDAHQGNGVCHAFLNDRRVKIYDQYNGEIYPQDQIARRRIDGDEPIEMGCNGEEYLSRLQRELPSYLDRVTEEGPVGLAIYNAGTDVYSGDGLGLLGVSGEEVLQRDRFVMEELRRRGMPMVMLTSGGYTDESHRLISRSVVELLRRG